VPEGPGGGKFPGLDSVWPDADVGICVTRLDVHHCGNSEPTNLTGMNS
jgi:hypothetical protein